MKAGYLRREGGDAEMGAVGPYPHALLEILRVLRGRASRPMLVLVPVPVLLVRKDRRILFRKGLSNVSVL